MSTTPIDLTQLPPPAAVTQLDFEAVLASMLADFQARVPGFDALVESDPIYKLLEAWAYRETLLRAACNDQVWAIMLATAAGADLDQIGARMNVARLVLSPADPDAVPPVAAIYETDDAFRTRIQLAPEAMSVAGPEGAYRYHALAVTGVKDVAISSPSPGTVLVSVLSASGIGVPTSQLLAAVRAALTAEDVRPLTDYVLVESANVGLYNIVATLYIQSGPDSAVVLALAQERIAAYVAAQHRLGRGVPLSGIYGALHVSGVDRVELATPLTSQPGLANAAYYCYDIHLEVGS